MLGSGGAWVGSPGSLAGGKYVRTTRFVSISSGTSGTVTLPPASEVVLDDFGGTVDAIVTQGSGGKPTQVSALTASGVVVATTFDASGNYAFTGTPATYPVILVYRVRQVFADFDSTATDIWGGADFHEVLPVANGGTGVTTSTGTGSVVLSNTPTLVTPVLGVATGTTLALTKTTAGDVLTWTNGAASNKTGYLYSSSTYVALAGSANSAGAALAIFPGTNLSLYGPDQSKTIVLDNTGAVVTGTLGATGIVSVGTSGAANIPLLIRGGSVHNSVIEFQRSDGAVKGYIGSTEASNYVTNASNGDMFVRSDTGGVVLAAGSGSDTHLRVTTTSTTASGTLTATGGLQNTAVGSTTRSTGAFTVVGIGAASRSDTAAFISIIGALSGADQSGLVSSITGSSSATSTVAALSVQAGTAVASFTCANVYGLIVSDASLGAGSSITTAAGVQVDDQTRGATNYGIRSRVSSGSGKWNLFIDGTALNHLAGRTLLGTTTDDGTNILQVTGAAKVTGALSSQMAGTANAIRLGQISDATTYGQISFNGVYTAAGFLGMAAAGTVGVFLNAPTGETAGIRINNSNILVASSTGVVVTGTIGATKATAGDTLSWTNAAASNKTGYLYSDDTYVGMFSGTGATGNGILISATQILERITAVGTIGTWSSTGLAVTGTASASKVRAGTTSTAVDSTEILTGYAATSNAIAAGFRNQTATYATVGIWNDSATGDNTLVKFFTSAAGDTIGTIDYNRTGTQFRITGAASGIGLVGNTAVTGAVIASNYVSVPSGVGFYPDGGGDTQIYESSANVITLRPGGTDVLSVAPAGVSVTGTIGASGAITSGATGTNGQVNVARTSDGSAAGVMVWRSAGTVGLEINSANGIMMTPGTRMMVGTTTDDGVNMLQVAGNTAITGTVSTTDPAGGAGPAWKLGVAASVSPTSPNRTIRIDIGGTSYYLAAKTTND